MLFRIAEGEDVRDTVDAEHVERVLGPHKFRPESAERDLVPGVATGLSTSAGGGDLLFIEATRMVGKGQLGLTGEWAGKPIHAEGYGFFETYR